MSDRRVAVFRERFLPPSETFVRDHVLNLPSWSPVALAWQREPGGLELPGIPVHEIGRATTSARIRNAIGRRLGADGERLRQRALTAAVAESRADVLHAHFGPDAALIRRPARSAGMPLVATFHGYDATMTPEALSTTPSGARLVRDWDALMRDAAAIITVSRFLAESLRERGADASKLHVIPCGVVTASLPWSPPPADGDVLFVGRLVEKKGLADLLGAMARMRAPRRLRVIGDGPLRGDLATEAERLRLDVVFLGTRDSEEVRRAMRDAAVVAMPSKRASNGDCEGLPVVSLEASAMGRPVVGYRHSGLVESVRSGETGLLAEEGDVAGLARLLDEAFADPARLDTMARAARSHIEGSFELRDCLGHVEAVYERVVS